QAVEVSTLIPLRRCSRCVLVGDPQQLSSTVISTSLPHYDFHRSIFERFIDAGRKPFLLTSQYRMHSDIMAFPSRLFYNDRLVSSLPPSTFQRYFHKDPRLAPYVFYDVEVGTEDRDMRAGRSLYNVV